MSDIPYRFTRDWFYWVPALWEKLTPTLPARKNFLEIGSFEGRSMVWTVENMLMDGGSIDCIDTFEGGEEYADETLHTAETNFEYNRNLVEQNFPMRGVYKHKGLAVNCLAKLMVKNTHQYDFIYIDGSHTARDTLTDACMAFHLLKNGGLMVFDDYLWGDPKDILHRPKLAIDAFINIFAEKVIVQHMGYQLVVRKVEQIITDNVVKNA